MKYPLAIATILTLFTGPAIAQESACAPRDTVFAALAAKYNETPRAQMLSTGGFMLYVLTKPDGSTYSIVSVLPTGTACILSVGSDFELVAAQQPGSAS